MFRCEIVGDWWCRQKVHRFEDCLERVRTHQRFKQVTYRLDQLMFEIVDIVQRNLVVHDPRRILRLVTQKTRHLRDEKRDTITLLRL